MNRGYYWCQKYHKEYVSLLCQRNERYAEKKIISLILGFRLRLNCKLILMNILTSHFLIRGKYVSGRPTLLPYCHACQGV